jgi:16S rRNA processing protein RimM
VNSATDHLVTLGTVIGAWGVNGWIKVRSYTDPLDNIVGMSPWTLRQDRAERVACVESAKAHGDVIVAKLEGIESRDQADALRGADIAVPRTAMAEPGRGEYYWADLEGLRVATTQGVELGRIARLFRTGSNDVMVVIGTRERLVPYIAGDVVKDVDLAAGLMVVDWDPEF